MTHTHSDGGAEAGWFAANFMVLMIVLVAAIILIGGAVLWQPWDTSSDGDGEGGLDVNVDVSGDDGESGGGGDGESSNFRIAPDRVVIFA
jgi:hypothetical protein